MQMDDPRGKIVRGHVPMSVGAKIPGELWMPPPRLSERALQSQVLDSVPLQFGTNGLSQL